MNAVFFVCGAAAIAAVASHHRIYGRLRPAGHPGDRPARLPVRHRMEVYCRRAEIRHSAVHPHQHLGHAGSHRHRRARGPADGGVPFKVASRRVASVVRPAVELLAGIPSVVYGLIGMMVLVPAVMELFHLKNGTCLFAAILVLAIMILPSIISVSETALNAVPPEYEEASLALGATKIETVFKVSIPAAKSGIVAGIVLGIGRAIGEAMAVMMVAGNVANMPGLFKSVTFLTTAVASEMSYASGLQSRRCSASRWCCSALSCSSTAC